MAAAHCLSSSELLQRQFLTCFLANPHYGSLINADGHAEVWTDWNDMSKFFQYGWRCTTNENAYSNRTLMGNWNQERYDLRNIVQPKPLPSQDINESLTGFQDINPSWILIDTNAQKSQLI
ncbi:cilia- and flagella-associated protein 68 isoform X3 [Rhinolophus sinicus]|uniref:cilia- and flagella-associated protein 68 isoform X3 n=1 Tax=Rhinolophus sinicus TaxID=89399 RepID=UPI003D7A4189